MFTFIKKTWAFVMLITASTMVFAEGQHSLSPAINAISDLYRFDTIYTPETVNRLKKEVGDIDDPKTVDNLKEKLRHIKEQIHGITMQLGECKNVNMDNEVKNVELLKEIESLEKELKAT